MLFPGADWAACQPDTCWVRRMVRQPGGPPCQMLNEVVEQRRGPLAREGSTSKNYLQGPPTFQLRHYSWGQLKEPVRPGWLYLVLLKHCKMLLCSHMHVVSKWRKRLCFCVIYSDRTLTTLHKARVVANLGYCNIYYIVSSVCMYVFVTDIVAVSRTDSQFCHALPCTVFFDCVPQGRIIHEAGEAEALRPGPRQGPELTGTTKILYPFGPRNFQRKKLGFF